MLKEEEFASLEAILSTIERERALHEDAYREVAANLRLEGLGLDEEAHRIFQRHVDGEITSEEFRTAINDLNDRKFRPVSLTGNGHP